MDFKEFKQHVKELMTAMGRTGIKRLAIKHQESEIELERGDPNPYMHSIAEQPAPLPTSGKMLPNSAMPLESKESLSQEHSSGRTITSPMVGTFYAAASPELSPFVKVGDVVATDDVVCIIEAMKVMNEVKAGLTGTVTEILVSSSDPVEFGTKLFKVR